MTSFRRSLLLLGSAALLACTYVCIGVRGDPSHEPDWANIPRFWELGYYNGMLGDLDYHRGVMSRLVSASYTLTPSANTDACFYLTEWNQHGVSAATACTGSRVTSFDLKYQGDAKVYKYCECANSVATNRTYNAIALGYLHL